MHAWCCCRPTFYKIYKKKSTEGFQSVPYVISLFSAMIWIYYALLKQNAIFLMTINTFCCVMQTIYIAVYIFYAPKKVRVRIFTNTLLNLFRMYTRTESCSGPDVQIISQIQIWTRIRVILRRTLTKSISHTYSCVYVYFSELTIVMGCKFYADPDCEAAPAAQCIWVWRNLPPIFLPRKRGNPREDSWIYMHDICPQCICCTSLHRGN